MSMVVGASIICLIIGIVLGAGIMFYVIRFRCKGILHGSGGGGPHYVSAKSQNLYVSLPMLDLTNTSTITSTSTLGRPKGKGPVTINITFSFRTPTISCLIITRSHLPITCVSLDFLWIF